MKDDEIKRAVRKGYARIASSGGSCCGPDDSGCGCGPAAPDASRALGYTDIDVQAVPDGANLGLGCGNPVALASLREGEVVLDLGCGAGFDCFLASRKVGPSGKVIGVDMTPEMLDRARENVRKGGYENVEFYLGEIEHLPVADGSVDAVISNCVVNLSPDKPQVFREVFRVLKPDGRLMVSDIVLLEDPPAAVKTSLDAYVACVAGAARKEDYLQAIQEAGLRDVRVVEEVPYPAQAGVRAASVAVEARKAS